MAGSVDLQVNGYAGVDFNIDGVHPDQFHAASAALGDDDVSCCLATVITDSLAAMQHRLGSIARAREADALVAERICGVHIEGPFLNPAPGFIGAHPVEHAREADLDDVKMLIDAASGLTRIVTLAPECDPGFRVTRWLADQGITVSAGHCDPTVEQLRGAIDAGLSMVTHLGNGCPLQLHRHDNVIQRVLSFADELYIGFIADGIHVPFVALGNYLSLASRAFIVTDAVSAAGMGPGTYTLAGQSVVVDEHLATWAEDRSHLVGSAMTMPRVRENLRRYLGYDEEVITRLTCTNPSAAIGLST